jgi:hypothetical protein
MKYLALFVFAFSCFYSQAFAEVDLDYREARIHYLMFGGDIGDPVQATDKDSKIAFSVEGKLAKKIFDSIGPDKKNLCTENDGSRFRSKDHDKISCVKFKEGSYICYFGFDLKTGKSIVASIC